MPVFFSSFSSLAQAYKQRATSSAVQSVSELNAAPVENVNSRGYLIKVVHQKHLKEAVLFFFRCLCFFLLGVEFVFRRLHPLQFQWAVTGEI